MRMNWLLNFILFDALFSVAVSLDEGLVAWIHSFGISLDKLQDGNDHEHAHSRRKRSLMNFHTVIQCAQPWAHNVLSTYGDYGCYCGFSGAGRPLDDTDQCCYMHDKCYDATEASARSFSERTIGSYLTGYSSECRNNTPVCLEDLNTPYQNAFCECDRMASLCFLTSRRTYNRDLFNLDTSKYCKENADLSDLQLNVHLLSKFYSCPMEPYQDRCCVDKGYNSAYQICCNGRVRKMPEDATDYACCGRRVYDTRRRSCCAGRLHHNKPHLQCCNSGQIVDTRRTQCPTLPATNSTLSN